MFKTSIKTTSLTTDAATSFFSNITGGCFGNDNSFLATLRALVAPRIKKGESISLVFGNSSYSAATIGNVPVERAVHAICDTYNIEDMREHLVVHNLSSNQEDNLANLKLLGEKFTSCYTGYYRLEKVKEFYRKSFDTDCFINPERRSVVVFVDNLDNRKLHYLQISILAFLPWYFNPEEGASELEMELINSLRETSSQKYEACLAKIAEQYDFKTARVKQLLSGFETRYEKIECEKVRREIANVDTEISNLNARIGSMLSRRNDICIKLFGLERKISEGEGGSEIMEYFLCNNKLVLESVTERDMFFSVKDYLIYFDREMAERTINNSRSFVYSVLDGQDSYRGISAEKMKKFMRAVFVDENPRLKIKTCAAYRFDLNGNVSPMGRHEFSHEFADCMPNTHIDKFTCMGNYSKTINQLLVNRDYIGALEQCAASCKSLNWGDSTVMKEFMRVIWGNSDCGYNNCCVELPDGRVVNPASAIQWLEQQEVATDGKETEEE
jgi:hypothetical protein